MNCMELGMYFLMGTNVVINKSAHYFVHYGLVMGQYTPKFNHDINGASGVKWFRPHFHCCPSPWLQWDWGPCWLFNSDMAEKCGESHWWVRIGKASSMEANRTKELLERG